MINLIDHTYFLNKLRLANVVTDNDVQIHLSNAISDYQYDFLNKILGAGLYKQFVEWYAINPADTTSPFYYLLNGKNFSIESDTVTWVGLINPGKQSPLANYCYFMYQRYNTTQTMAAGEAKIDSQNAVSANAYNKSKSAWDQMAEWLKDYCLFMDTFFTGPNTVSVANLLPYIAPIQIQAGVTTGFISGVTSFAFDGTSGTQDWRGYDIFPERIGQGTMIRDVQYTWNISTGRFDLLQIGDKFQPSEYFNITFGLNGVTYTQLVSNGYWNDYRCRFHRQRFTKIINPF